MNLTKAKHLSAEDQRAMSVWQLRTRVATGALSGGLLLLFVRAVVSWTFAYPEGTDAADSVLPALMFVVAFLLGSALSPMMSLMETLYIAFALPWAPLLEIGLEGSAANAIGMTVNFAILGGVISYYTRSKD